MAHCHGPVGKGEWAVGCLGGKGTGEEMGGSLGPPYLAPQVILEQLSMAIKKDSPEALKGRAPKWGIQSPWRVGAPLPTS